MSHILYINRSTSHCECSGRSVDPYLERCPRCGVVWDTVSSDEAGKGVEAPASRMRPDLQPYFPWQWWPETEEDQRALDELRATLHMDENQEDV